MELLKQGFFTGERALYHKNGLNIVDSTFADGESPLKECSDIKLSGCFFKWKYPLWYSRNIEADNCVLLETARSGIWYTHNITMRNSVIEAPKTFRRSSSVKLYSCNMPVAKETFWNCTDIHLSDVSATGDYFGLGSKNIYAENFRLNGNYAFDGAENIEIHNAKLVSKDAFWNCRNVTVSDSLIIGEYLGWNSENVTFVNCTVDSNQGLCYMKGLKMVNCKLLNTDLAFELSVMDAEIASKIDSVKNPISGRLVCEDIGELILDTEMIDPEKTEIVVKKKADE